MASAYPTRLETLAREAAFKLKRSVEYRTSAAVLLAECKLRIDAGDPEAHGVAWSEYCRVRFPSYSLHDIGRLIEAGAQPDDPDGEVHRAARHDAFDGAWAAFVALDLAGQREFLRCGAAYAIHPEDAPERAAADPRAEPPRALDWLA